MSAIRYRGFRFAKLIVQHATWFHLRFTSSLRDVAGLLAERGIIVAYETIRVWMERFDRLIALSIGTGAGSRPVCGCKDPPRTL